ncbi:unnamed protein product [Prorocentrum cordatum]|uniref:Uncharacterized protein n=1 Tax=Prorocentrum cordatum TaxID=2364126 RepID=A0ABN9SDE0_9DINO|nr:unnamed protein product [Polarella glacialis]
MGHWNMGPQVLDIGWITKLRAAGLSNQPAQLDLGASTWPRWPVHLALVQLPADSWQRVFNEPKPMPKEAALPGCAPVGGDAGLQGIWGPPPMGIETEILARRALVGEEHGRAAGRGAGGAAELVWRKISEISWRAPRKRHARPPQAQAWAAATQWALYLPGQHGRLTKALHALRSEPTAKMRRPSPLLEKRLAAGGAAVAAVHDLLQRVEDYGHWARLPVWARAPFQRGGDAFQGDDWDKSLKSIVVEGKKKEKLDSQVAQARWKGWTDQAFTGGAGAARATSKAPACQEVAQACDGGDGDAIVERELRPWEDIWNYHGLKQMRLPVDAGVWDHLAPLERRAVRDVIRSFQWSTGVGQSGIPPRALGGISDEAVDAMIAVFHKCEDLMQWPSSRLVNVMAWEQAHPSDLTWGAGPRRSSSGPACDLNLAKEQAKLAGWDSAEAALDLWKAYEMVAPEAQMQEARAIELPLRLTWMLLSTDR